MAFTCYPRSDPNSVWSYCPSFALAVVYAVLFGLAILLHSAQAIIYRKPFAMVLIMGAIWETAGYIFRAINVTNQLSSGLFLAQLLFILLAPLWINAFVYMVLGRMIHFHLYPNDRLYRLKARKITLFFVICDIVAFIVQALGGALTSNTNPYQTQVNGLHIYMGGVGLQLLFIIVFISIAVRFHMIMRRQGNIEQDSKFRNSRVAQRQLLTLYIVIGLLIYRNVYRLVEFSAGVNSYITLHEWFTYVFDATPMLLCLILFGWFHPGKFLQGERCDFAQETRELKAAKSKRKEDKRMGKHENLELNQEMK